MEGKAEAEQRSWSDLPRDVLFLIFQKLGAIEVLLAAQAVCTSWRQLALEPRLWHSIDLRLKPSNLNDCLVEKLTFVAVNRSDRYIEEFYAGGFIWDDTFTYIANRTTGLRSFALISPRGFTEKGLVDFICQCPLLEQLEITNYSISPKFYRKIGRACPKLKCFQLNRRFIIREDRDSISEDDRNDEAFEIANNLPVQNNWAELPHDILFLIFRKLGAIEVLLAAQAVCTSWRQLAFDPCVWRSIDLCLKPRNLNDCLVEKLTHVAVDRCNGYIEEFYTEGFIWDDTFTYIASRTTGLRCLALISPRGFTRNALVEFVRQCPLLEELEIVDYSISLPNDLELTPNFSINLEAYRDAYRDIGHACPRLKCLRLNRRYIIHEGWNSNSDTVRNGEALAIANSMPQLRKLELIANPLTDNGLHAILEKCSQLESLDIRRCYNVNVVAGLKEKLNEMKTVSLPDEDNDYDITLNSCLTALPSVLPDRVPPDRRLFCDFCGFCDFCDCHDYCDFCYHHYLYVVEREQEGERAARSPS